jgi:collagenase-like PrtC family protease
MCIDKDAKKKKPNVVLESPGKPDHWVRKVVDVYRLEVWDDDKHKWKKLDDRRYICGVDGRTYWELDRHHPYTAPARATPLKRGHGVKETKLEQRLAIAFMDDEGKYTGYGWETKGGKHSTKSCWHSMVPKHKY